MRIGMSLIFAWFFPHKSFLQEMRMEVQVDFQP